MEKNFSRKEMKVTEENQNLIKLNALPVKIFYHPKIERSPSTEIRMEAGMQKEFVSPVATKYLGFMGLSQINPLSFQHFPLLKTSIKL